MPKRVKKGVIVKKILLTVAATAAAGGFVLALAAMPGLGVVAHSFIQWYKNQDRQGRYRIRKTFERLRQERLIEMNETSDGKTKIILTEEGKKKVLEYRFEDIKIEPMKKWDKKWRMVIFDIPEHHKKARNALRDKLRELEFYQLQKSVWIHPYECRDEINFIIEFFNISSYVRMAEVNHFDGDKLIKEKFNI